jgi:tRNA A-37 threonylcarbamoyl transferase component Bud32
MTPGDAESSGLTDEARARVEQLVIRFEAAYREGRRPGIDDGLPADGPERRAVLVHRIHIDLERRLKAGEAVRVEGYLARYPELARAPEVVLDLLAAEFRQRQRHEPGLTVAEYLERFPQVAGQLEPLLDTTPPEPPRKAPEEPTAPSPPPTATAGTRIRCPSCNNPIQLADNRSDEVLCPVCGSTFRVQDTHLTSTASGMRQLGKFQLLERVGVGAFGAVWKARDTDLDRLVAIKVPHRCRISQFADAESNLAEARLLASLDHPNIVPVLHVGTTEDGLPFVVSKFIQGSDLKERLKAHTFSFAEAADLVATVSEALHYAHRKGLVHRDIKPGNILIDASAKPCVVDFGLALKEEDLGK